MSKAVKSLAEFERTLKQAGDALVCVDFHAKWCGPCKVISPVFEALAKSADASKAVFITVDVDDAAVRHSLPRNPISPTSIRH
jgi:thiol-disulfide isomerase/thioredoxin